MEGNSALQLINMDIRLLGSEDLLVDIVCIKLFWLFLVIKTLLAVGLDVLILSFYFLLEMF